MSERQAEDSSTYQDPDKIFLDETDFDADPFQIVIESSDPVKLRYRLTEWLAASPNSKVKSQRKTKVEETLNLSSRQVERLLKQYFNNELQEDAGVVRSDKGTHRIDEYWRDYIPEVYKKSLKDKHPLKPAEVVREVQRHAVVDLGREEGDHPHPATIYRVLKPHIEDYKKKKKIRNPGSGSWRVVETRDGESFKASFSNQIIQCDHTKLDIRIVGADGKVLQWRPWLTTVVDTFSGCLIGYRLWHKQPGAYEVGLALRHAILPKNYPAEYKLNKDWNVYGPPLQYFFTDGGKDLSASKHIKAIGKKLNFQCKLRARPNQGGVIERLFKTINTQVLEPLPGYQPNRSNKEQIKKAEKEACLTIDHLDMFLAGYFCDDYNHQDYPYDKRYTRYEIWFQGMGKKLPEPLDERELDLLLMIRKQATVQAHGTVVFKNINYRCDELKLKKGEYVNLRYDPDHVLTMLAYSQGEEFIGFAHAINMDMQELTLYELEQLNKESNAKSRSHSNYHALLALDNRKNVVEERKLDKKQHQQAEQKKLRSKDKGKSNVVESREARKIQSSKASDLIELLPERIDHSRLKPVESTIPDQTEPKPISSEHDNEKNTGESERHRLIVSRNKQLKRIW
ncbi:MULTISPECIES: Mu transposase C-terminal domain-containing protein [Cyanophyceae]|uniref:Mu transposase C-terminal domain-containing protein n=1 Tax=Cyanophyceae TaxID=3028117 RepID=UPI00168209ED|nr:MULTISPECIES: Mu transposase C-terminal domain-containing protein [Cyanophyceae]MBD1918448.1 Mu transposase C-terminal domain-containing protein [Phormidium sp. FACHB-77]MBD2031337.1 Mu transposase C-terminal domain-containing protein [Phormidium sp. FACHB-322]MBD2049457.1 Mu transposase C-terminal domain-containing protein [Leptolyngbya sp. FACHB-60]